MPVVRPAALRVTAAGTWAGTIAADAADAEARVWLPMLGAAVVASLTALLSAAVAERIDRAYMTMASAFIQRETQGPAASHGRHALTVVPGPGKARP